MSETATIDQFRLPTSRVVDHAELDEKEQARQQRLTKGVKAVVIGSPHSGKSVFIESLMGHFDADLNATMLSGCPDGELLWQRFSAPKHEQGWFYQSVYEVLARRLPSSELLRKMAELSQELKGITGKS